MGIAAQRHSTPPNPTINIIKMKNIVEAKPLNNNILHVRFDDGESFDVDIKPFIKSGVSNALKDRQFFDAVKVEDGYITWPNGYDFCPEFLYEYAKTHQE